MSVAFERHDGVALITMDNPPVNAVNTAMRNRLIALARELDADPGINAVVLTGTGKFFVGGADIKEFDRAPEEPTLPELIDRIERAAKPWVVALNGITFGGGLEIALGCHYRLASANARFGLPEVNLGFIPGAGGTQRLPRLIGIGAARVRVLLRRCARSSRRSPP